MSALDADLRDGGPWGNETYAVLGEHEMHGGQVCAFADGDGECKMETMVMTRTYLHSIACSQEKL